MKKKLKEINKIARPSKSWQGNFSHLSENLSERWREKEILTNCHMIYNEI